MKTPSYNGQRDSIYTYIYIGGDYINRRGLEAIIDYLVVSE